MHFENRREQGFIVSNCIVNRAAPRAEYISLQFHESWKKRKEEKTSGPPSVSRPKMGEMEVKSEAFTPPGTDVATSRAGGGRGGGKRRRRGAPWLSQSCDQWAQYLRDGPQAVCLSSSWMTVFVCTCVSKHSFMQSKACATVAQDSDLPIHLCLAQYNASNYPHYIQKVPI